MSTTPDSSLLRKFLKCVAVLAGQATWTFVKRMAVYLLAAIVLAVPCALVVWKLAVPDGAAATGASATIGVAVLLCYLAAGIVWAVHRSYSAAVERVVPIFTEESPELLNGLLDPLLAKCPVHDHQIAVADARNALEGLFGGNDWAGELAGGSFPVLGAVRRMIARRCVRAELLLANEVLDSLERKGEEHITATSLKGYLQDR